MTVERMHIEHLLQGPDTAGAFPHVDPIRIEESQPGAVITPVFQPQEPCDQDRAGLVRPGVTDDATHASSPCSAGRQGSTEAIGVDSPNAAFGTLSVLATERLGPQ
jgi:hypothetical protein